MQNLKKELSTAKKEYDKKYGIGFFSVECAEEGKRVSITGSVLLPSQLEHAKRIAKKHFSGQVLCSITVLSSRETPPLYHAKPSTDFIDIFKKTVKSIENISAAGLTRNRSTQALSSDPAMRVLYVDDTWALVQLFDDTLGWAKTKSLEKLDAVDTPKFSKNIHYGKLKSVALEYEGVPYLWGGVTKKGIDCSGLIQRIFFESSNVVLPKNSIAQSLLGDKVSLEQSRIGDLFFFVSKEKKTSHVGLLLEQENRMVFHSCLKNKKVALEPLETLLHNYTLTSIKRL